MVAVTEPMTLQAGASCWVTINRTMDGSYGTLAINSTDPYLLVFDDSDTQYVSGDLIGLIEEDSYFGWAPKSVFVANIGLVNSDFVVTFESAVMLTGLIAPILVLATF